MAGKSGIQWTEATWNPVTGCTKVSQGCKHCYAKHQAWPRLAASRGTVYFGREFEQVATHPERLDLPLRWTRPRRVFVNSMSDLFHEDVPDEFVAAVFTTMAKARQHTFQVLTKRADRMRELLTAWGRDGFTLREGFASTLPNVWLGVSVEDQRTADERTPLLLQTPAAVRWISAEPLLAPVDLTAIPRVDPEHPHPPNYDLADLDWIVVGGESGPGARPMHPDWARSLRDQCVAARVPFFFKQWGEWLPISQHANDFTDRLYRSNRTAKLHEDQSAIDDSYGRHCVVPHVVVQSDGSVHEITAPGAFLQGAGGMSTFKVGKKAAGRSLDGRTWDEYPKPLKEQSR